MANTHTVDTEGKEKKGFDVLALDSSVLVAAHWPHPPVDLDNLVTLCRRLRVAVLIPSVVLSEVRVITLEKSAEAIQKARDALATVEKRLPGLVEAGDIAWPSPTDRERAYDAAIAALEERWGWFTAPVPNVSLADAIDQAAKHEPPFPATDTAFRDSVIAWSLVEKVKGFVRKDFDPEVGMVAADSFFLDKRVSDRFARDGIKLHVFRTIGEAWAAAERMARDSELLQQFKRWEKQTDQLMRAVQADRQRMGRYILENLTVSEVLLGIDGKIDELKGVTVGEVVRANMPLPGSILAGRPDPEATVDVRIKAILNRFVDSPLRTLRVGERVAESVISGTTESRVVEIEGHVTLTLEVKWPDNADDLAIVDYKGIEFTSSAQAELERQMMIDAWNRKFR